MEYDFKSMREKEWPVLSTMTFLDAACVSFPPQRAVHALKALADMSARQDEANSSAHHIALDDTRHKAYVEAAKLLNAQEDEIAIVESTTYGLNVAANAFPLEDGDNIITTNLEFIQVALPWCVMRRNKDIDIRIAKTKDNRFCTDDFAALCDDRTKLIVISSIEWCNGWQMDLASLGEFCRSRKIRLILDCVQHMGVMDLDTSKFHADLLVAGGHKWMNAPFGAGVMYINRETLDEIDPVFWGYLNTEEPAEGWGGYWENPNSQAVNDWTFVDSARRFEIGGTSNYGGAVVLGESLGLVNEIGIKTIEKRVIELSDYCISGLEDIGATLITHPDPGHRSGIVIARLYEDLSLDRQILKNLHSEKIFIAQRFTDKVGGFRISCQYYNLEEDLDVMLDGMKEEIKRIGKSPDYQRPW